MLMQIVALSGVASDNAGMRLTSISTSTRLEYQHVTTIGWTYRDEYLLQLETYHDKRSFGAIGSEQVSMREVIATTYHRRISLWLNDAS